MAIITRINGNRLIGRVNIMDMRGMLNKDLFQASFNLLRI